MKRARELVNILSIGEDGKEIRYLKEYLENAELDRGMKLVILGLFYAFFFHMEGGYCALVRKALRILC